MNVLNEDAMSYFEKFLTNNGNSTLVSTSFTSCDIACQQILSLATCLKVNDTTCLASLQEA